MFSKEREIFKNVVKGSIKQMNYLKKLIMVTWNSLLVVFSELKNPVAFLDSVKRREILIEEAQNKQKEFTRY